ncbi:MAG: acyltransferase [Candidatus Riflebacteria bacterium]|nr:acyltransferase [Candidatus Riflebacteria bacterium]
MTRKIMEPSYRSEIDGLRAISVISVVLFHSKLGLPGGFVGVDVFFVISGYLIFGIIKRELEADQFSIFHFWERRIRRIVPAAFATVFITLCAGYLFMISTDLTALGKSAIANALLSSNLFFWRTIDYFTDTDTGLPLLHTWSLGVEEQFYLVFPLILWFIFTRKRQSNTDMTTSILLAMFIVSFSLSTVGVYLMPRATFYLLPARAWELLLGGGINYLPRKFVPITPVARELSSWLGLTLISFSLLAYTETMLFPGPGALAPCIGAGLIILGNEHIGGTQSTSVGRLLSFRPLLSIGLISYSIYLFHWPILVNAKYLSGGSLDLQTTVALLLLLVLFAWLSFEYLEQPIRKKRILETRVSVFGFAVLYIFLTLVAGVLFWKVLPSRYLNVEKTVNRFISERDDSAVDVNENQIIKDQISRFGHRTSQQIDFLLLGDSHARMSISAFEEFAIERELCFATITHSSLQPLVEYRDPSPNTREIDSVKWVESAVDYVIRHKIRTVVLAAKWEEAFTDLGKEKFQLLLEKTIDRFVATGAGVYLMIDIPVYKVSVPRRLIQDFVAHKSSTKWQMTPTEYEKYNEPFLSFRERIRSKKEKYLDPRLYLLDKTTGCYSVSASGSSIYYDAHHLTVPASKQYLGKMIRDQFLIDSFSPWKMRKQNN